MASRARVESYAAKECTSFNEAKRRLGAKHAKGSARRAPPPDRDAKGGSKT